MRYIKTKNKINNYIDIRQQAGQPTFYIRFNL